MGSTRWRSIAACLLDILVALTPWYLSKIREWQKYSARIMTLEGFESRPRRPESQRL